MQVVGEAHNRAPHSVPSRSLILRATALRTAPCAKLWACSRPSWSTSSITG